jgi:hypothetical protein
MRKFKTRFGVESTTMSERFISALVVDAFLLFAGFESAIGQWFRKTYPSHVAVALGIIVVSLGTWAHLRRPDGKTERDKFQLWAVISLFVAVFVAFGQDEPRLPRDTAISLFLLFSIGKTIYHGDNITGRS